MPDAAYYRAWRAAHPEYRERQRRVRAARRQLHGRGDRKAEYAKRQSRAAAPIPPLHQGHDIFDHAKRLARISNSFTVLTHPFYDDLVSEIALALVEGRSPMEARSDFLRLEYDWRRHVGQLFDDP